MVTWIARRGKRATTPAPSHAPAAALPTAATNNIGSIRWPSTKMRASASAAGRMADVQGAGNQFVGDDAAQFVDCRRGRKRSDPQGIEEIRDEADQQFDGVGRRSVVLRRAPRIAPMMNATAAKPMAT